MITNTEVMKLRQEYFELKELVKTNPKLQDECDKKYQQWQDKKSHFIAQARGECPIL